MFNRFNPFFYSMPSWGHRAFVLLACIFSLLAFAPLAQAQDGGPDPATSVEVSSTTIWRDAVSTGSVTVTCKDANGKAVPNDSVTISITSPGEITAQSGMSYTYSSSTTGTTGTDGTVTVTAKSTDLTLAGNDATATVTASADAASGTGSVLFKGALQLLCNNVNAASQTQTCSVGELQSLQASLLSGVSCTATWTANGATPIGGWNGASSPAATTTTPFPPDNSENPLVSLFLTTTGSDATTATVNDGAATATATTSFSVSKPNFSFTAVQAASAAGIGCIALGTDVAYGITNGTHGIQFTGGGGSGGILSNAQIVYTDNATDTFQGGTPQTVDGSFTNQPGLDIKFPYLLQPGSPPGSTDDNPYQGNSDNTLIDIHETSFTAIMYLMWTSSKSGSIPIPVESISWNWYGEATFKNNTTRGTLINSSPAISNIQGTPLNNGVLTWVRTWS